MNTVWKFTDQIGLEKLLGGHIRLRSLEHFRAIELRFGDRIIGDLSEGLSENRLTAFDPTTASEAVLLELTGQKMIEFDRTSRLKVGEITQIMMNPHSHILSMAKGNIENLAHRFPYNKVIAIDDPEAFAAALFNEAFVEQNPNLLAHDIFSSPQVGEVQYGEKVRTIGSSAPDRSGPFWKPMEYSGQSEFRIVMPAISPWLADSVHLYLADAARFLREVEHPGGRLETASEWTLPLPANELVAQLRTLEAKRAEAMEAADLQHGEDRRPASEIWQKALRERGFDAIKHDEELQRRRGEIWMDAARVHANRIAAISAEFDPQIEFVLAGARFDYGLRRVPGGPHWAPIQLTPALHFYGS